MSAILFVFILIAVLGGCGKKKSETDGKDTVKKRAQDINKIRDSTDIYGTGYFDYKDTIETFHMGYNIPRDSAYKVQNLKAFEDMNLLIAKDSLNPGPYLDRGNHLLNIQKTKEAIRDYDMYIKLNPYNHSAYQNRGTAHERLKQFDEALYDYSKVIELKPNDTIAFFNKGVVYDAIENPWQAIKEYDEVVKRDPRLAKAYYNRGAAYERVADYDRALQDYEKAVQYNPKYKDELAKKMDYLNYTK
jgi:tetratricopeptide (TPR) repeat protein